MGLIGVCIELVHLSGGLGIKSDSTTLSGLVVSEYKFLQRNSPQVGAPHSRAEDNGPPTTMALPPAPPHVQMTSTM
jgi:hypothetical protein